MTIKLNNMTVGALKEKLAEYPDSMEVVIDVDNVKVFVPQNIYEIENIIEDGAMYNTVIIKI